MARTRRVIEHACREDAHTRDENRRDGSAVSSPPTLGPLPGRFDPRLHSPETTPNSGFSGPLCGGSATAEPAAGEHDRGAGDDGHDGVIEVAQMVLPLSPVTADQVAEEGER